MSGLVSFLGGSAFRSIWGEFSHWFTAKQEHKQEMERMQLSNAEAAAQHARNLEAQRLQSDLGVQVIRVQAETNIDEIDADGRNEVVKSTTRIIGIKWIDAWNASIRPAVASWAVIMLTLGDLHLIVISAVVMEIAGAALGIYLADRVLMKRGK
jgi:hypothetical protein